jgi:F-type H+-transporting ATPase subunit b
MTFSCRSRHAALHTLSLLTVACVLTGAVPVGVSASHFQASTTEEPKRSVEGPSQELSKQSREAAGEEKGESEEFKKSPSVRFLARVTGMSLEGAYWLAVLLNFAVIALAVLWISRSKLPGVFRGRTQSIQKAMEEARRTSEDANRRLSEIEARLSKLDAEVGSMRTAAEQESAAEEARIREAAEQDTRKIVESAELEIDAAAKSARRELKAYAAELAVSIAREQIRVDSSTDQALVRNFSEQLGNAEDNGSGRGKDGH